MNYGRNPHMLRTYREWFARGFGWGLGRDLARVLIRAILGK